MFNQKNLKNCSLVLMFLCGNLFAMGSDCAGPSIARGEDKTIEIRSGNETFTLTADEATKLGHFSDLINAQWTVDRQNPEREAKNFIDVPFDVATGTGDLFKGLLGFQFGVLLAVDGEKCGG